MWEYCHREHINYEIDWEHEEDTVSHVETDTVVSEGFRSVATELEYETRRPKPAYIMYSE